APAGHTSVHIERIHPVLIESQEAYERAAIILGHPKLGVRYDPFRDPAPCFVIGVGGHRDRGLRSLAGAEVERPNHNGIAVGSPPKLKVHPMMIPVSKTNVFRTARTLAYPASRAFKDALRWP